MTKADRPLKNEGTSAHSEEQNPTEGPPSSDSETANREALSDEPTLSDDAWRQQQSRRIYYLRAQTGLTQEEFADVLGWSTSKQSQIEQNADTVRIRPLDVMAARFIAEHPLEALKLTRGISETVREKLLAYVQQVEDFDGL